MNTMMRDGNDFEGEVPVDPGRPTSASLSVTAGTGLAVQVRAGQRIHIVNTHGYQVADTWAVKLPGGDRHLSMSHSRLATGRVAPKQGDVLVDDRRQPMLRLVEDTSGVDHDTLVPACDAERYRALGHQGWHASCSDNFTAAVTAHGLSHVAVPDPLNFFMAVPISTDGRISLAPSTAPPGSRVVLHAEVDVLVVVSACPQDLVPINGADYTVRNLDLHVEEQGFTSDGTQ